MHSAQRCHVGHRVAAELGDLARAIERRLRHASLESGDVGLRLRRQSGRIDAGRSSGAVHLVGRRVARSLQRRALRRVGYLPEERGLYRRMTVGGNLVFLGRLAGLSVATTGDVEFEGASQKAAYITPVPGGVGPLTTTILMRNTVELFKGQLK